MRSEGKGIKKNTEMIDRIPESRRRHRCFGTGIDAWGLIGGMGIWGIGGAGGSEIPRGMVMGIWREGEVR
jgi:hypothetical protein